MLGRRLCIERERFDFESRDEFALPFAEAPQPGFVGKDRGPFDRSIDVLMSRLRKKLDADTQTPIFKTVRNGGYQMTVQVKTLPVQR